MTEAQKEYIITEARLYQMEQGYRLKTNAKEVRLCPYNAKSSEAVLGERVLILENKVSELYRAIKQLYEDTAGDRKIGTERP